MVVKDELRDKTDWRKNYADEMGGRDSFEIHELDEAAVAEEIN